ncbi:MAG TPA: sensor domain-containing diguanylate cyclase [Pyrinomonadaceae bacterium]|nr:sensor domain-containing diguanylate cyclase [Pyrinomonadaceae bacterium]
MSAVPIRTVHAGNSYGSLLSRFMSKHVVLLAEAHEAPQSALLEALSDAKVEARIEVLREAEVAAALALGRQRQSLPEATGHSPLAVLYEIDDGADMLDVYAAVEYAAAAWPNVPVVACRRHSNAHARHNILTPDGSALRRAGFRSVADEPAQISALLREMEEHGNTGQLQLTRKLEDDFGQGTLLLPPKLSTKNLRSAFELVASLHFATDQRSAAHTALAGLAPLVHADRWTVFLIAESSNGQSGGFEPLAARGLTETEREIPEDWRRAILADTDALLSGTESKSARLAVNKLETVRKRETGRRVMAVPLASGERVIGVLEAVREGTGARSFTKSEASLISALAVPIASALANSVRIAEAERLSQTDDLTKLHNARYLRQYLVGEIRRSRRYNSHVTALFLDIDDFKKINDEHGHLVGSHVLMEVAAVLLLAVRDTDVVSRYGGDEFVIVLPETNIEQAAYVAERMRRKISNYSFNGGRSLSLTITVSCGVASFPENAQSPQQLVACADSAMYEAKAAGKNCVQFALSPGSQAVNEK